MIRKLLTFFETFKTLKNWEQYLLEPKMKIEKEYFIYETRENVRVKLRPQTFDRITIREILIKKIYTKKHKIKKNDIIVDVGAQIGVFSLYASKKAKKVIAIEPEPENYKLLLENIRLNNKKNIFPINSVVSKSEKEQRFQIINDTGGCSLYQIRTQKRCSKKKRIFVTSVTLDYLFDSFKLSKIDFLKLDCEGAEYEILESSISVLPKIKVLVIECHLLENKSADTLKTFLEKNGYLVCKEGVMLYAKRNDFKELE